ncbi:hypothetical protein GCM10027287_39250 [Bordetella muralis]
MRECGIKRKMNCVGKRLPISDDTLKDCYLGAKPTKHIRRQLMEFRTHPGSFPYGPPD